MAPIVLQAAAWACLIAFAASRIRYRKKAKAHDPEQPSQANIRKENARPEHAPIQFLGIPFPSVLPDQSRQQSALLPFTQKPQQKRTPHIPEPQDKDSDELLGSVKVGDPGVSEPASHDPGSLVFSISSPGDRFNRLVVLRMNGLENNEDLLQALRYSYQHARGWRGFFVKVKEIQFVQFDFRGARPRISNVPDIPPDDRLEYEYQPRPAQCVPPVDPDIFAHYFNSPAVDVSRSLLIQNLPKLVDADQYASIASGSDRGPDVGWGINLREEVRFPFRTLKRVSNGLLLTLVMYHLTKRFVGKEVFFAEMFILSATIFIHSLYVVYRGLCYSIDRFPRSYHPVIVGCRIDVHPHHNHEYLRVIIPAVRKACAHWYNLLDSAFLWANRRDQTQWATYEEGYCQSCGVRLARHSSDATVPHVPNFLDRFNFGFFGQRRSRIDNIELPHRSHGEQENSRPQRNRNEQHNPQHSGSDEDDSEDDTSSQGSNHSEDFDRDVGELYLHLIFPGGSRGKAQFPVKVTHFKHDVELFCQLNDIYRKHRGHWRALWKVKALRPVKYRLRNHTNVHTFYDPSDLAATMPSIDTQDTHPEYTPPLLYSEEITHTFFHPYSQEIATPSGPVYRTETYNRLPKRRGQLKCLLNSGIVEGYGVEFLEGFNYKNFIYVELLILFCAVVVSVLYAAIARDAGKLGTAAVLGAAATLGSFVLVVGQFLFAGVLALAEKYEAFRY